MRRILIISTMFFMFAVAGYAQECPAGKVCISPEAARKALEDSDTAKAQAVEIRVKDDAITAYKAELATLRTELAKAVGEKTGAEQMNVRLTAIIDILLKSVRPKKIGLINF
jgi:hypothetical protein